ncbi:hypothetical protein WKW80_17455 [Variovorax humicola]|uniref:Tetratricopeptide repeat protein n=1 Tax=Variovorax humicola TaxID=1769758 RepID=A0ABU8W2C1_9BURK
MYKRLVIQLGLVLALAVPVAALAQADTHPLRTNEPTIDDIYKAASSGRLREADEMIGKVLAAHPGSGKAHFVHAELLAKEGNLAAARSEFAKANELAPGLPFARPEAVAGLAERLDASKPPRAAAGTSTGLQSPSLAAPESAPGMGAPAKLGILALLIAAGVFVFRRLGRARAAAAGPNTNYAAGPGAPSYANGPTGYAQNAPVNPASYAPAPAPGGLPGGLGGALMTGAAMGLGAVAVEEAVRHFSHRDGRSSDLERHPSGPSTFGDNLGPDTSADMGGNDFGIQDAGSWDSGTDNSGSDW